MTVQIIVDGKNYPFYLDEIEFKATTSIGKREFHELVNALASSKRKSFVIEFPKYDKAETFSLLDARKSLGIGKQSTIRECENHLKDWQRSSAWLSCRSRKQVSRGGHTEAFAPWWQSYPGLS